jgi:hypothetical protein
MAARPVVHVTIQDDAGVVLHSETRSAFNAGIRASEAAISKIARDERATYEGDRPVRIGDVYTRRWVSKNGRTLTATISKDAPSIKENKMASRTTRASHRVADFNTLDDLIEHARDELGATHVDPEHDTYNARIFFPRKDGQYEVANTWKKAGYWHATGPGSREIIRYLPPGTQVIGGRRGHAVRDYEAIDRRDRVIAGPFKSYGDAKDAAGPAGAVRFVPSRGKPSKATEVRAPRARGAEEAGAAYAKEQLESDHFMDWVREQLLEASKMPASDVLPLEDKHDAKIIARNMLQQLEWDTRRETHESAEFYKGFRSTLDASRDWLADELLTMNQEIHGSVGESRVVKDIHSYDIDVFFRSEGTARKFEKQLADIIQKPLVSQGALKDGYRLVYGPIERDDFRRLEGEIYKKVGNAGLCRLVQNMYAGGEEKRRRPKAKRSVRRRRTPA